MAQTHSSFRLHLPAILRANAIFSSLSGVAFLIAPESIAGFVGLVTAGDLRGIGVQLLIFAGAVWWVGRGLPSSARWVRAIIVGDGLWVAGSIAVLLAAPSGLTSRGSWAIALVATIVGAFAVTQTVALRRG